MKTNKLSASETFAKDIQGLMSMYYRKTLSENIKRGIQRKKELKEQLLATKSK
jgi:hypothetical protein